MSFYLFYYLNYYFILNIILNIHKIYKTYYFKQFNSNNYFINFCLIKQILNHSYYSFERTLLLYKLIKSIKSIKIVIIAFYLFIFKK